MKKVIRLFCVIFVFAVCLCGCQKADTGNAEDKAENAVRSLASADGSSNTNGAEESLTEKLIREIDDEYSEKSQLPEFGTTIGMSELAAEYTEKWKQVADEYYNKIMEYDGIVKQNDDAYSSEDLHAFVSNMKTNWEQYYQTQCENYSEILKTIYNGGTIGGPIFANYKYALQKDWALQLVGIYQQLYV